MAIESFETLLAHPAPAFACCACGERHGREALIVPVTHIANAPADLTAIGRIPNVPGTDAARDFYQSHDGGLVYTAKGLMANQGGPEEGVEIFSLREWDARTQETVDFWNESEYADHEMPYGRNDFIAIAHSRCASTYIHWVVRGPNAGKVYWWATTMPPDANDPPLANSFEEFIDIVCTKPVHFLNDLVFCYTRFSDGKTDTQWIPKRYIADSGSHGRPAAG